MKYLHNSLLLALFISLLAPGSSSQEYCSSCKLAVRFFDGLLCDEAVSEQLVQASCAIVQTPEVGHPECVMCERDTVSAKAAE